MTSEKLTHKQFVENVIRLMDHYVDGQEKKIVKHMKNLVQLYDDVDYRTKYMMSKWNKKIYQYRHLVYDENDLPIAINIEDDVTWEKKTNHSIRNLKPDKEFKKLKGLEYAVWQNVFDGLIYILDDSEFLIERNASDLPKIVDFIELMVNSPIPIYNWYFEGRKWKGDLWEHRITKDEKQLEQNRKDISKQVKRVTKILQVL